jgi:hypothetical protein
MENAGKKKPLTVFGVLLVLGGWYVAHNDADIAMHVFSCDPGNALLGVCFGPSLAQIRTLDALGATAILLGIGSLISAYMMDDKGSIPT